MKRLRSKVGLEDNPFRVLATFLTTILTTVALTPIFTFFVWIPVLALSSTMRTAQPTQSMTSSSSQLTTWSLYLGIVLVFVFLYSKLRKMSLKMLGLINAISLVGLTFFVLFFL